MKKGKGRKVIENKGEREKKAKKGRKKGGKGRDDLTEKIAK